MHIQQALERLLKNTSNPVKGGNVHEGRDRMERLLRSKDDDLKAFT
jgi:hypothetical protein